MEEDITPTLVAKALALRSKDKLSTFSPSSLGTILKSNNDSIKPAALAILALQAVDRDWEVNKEVTPFFNVLTVHPALGKRFIDVDISTLSEESLVNFCQEFGIKYPTSAPWEEVLYRALHLHAVFKYSKELHTYERSKPKPKLKPKHKHFDTPVTVRIVHTVNGVDVKTLTKHDLFICMLKLKNSIKTLAPLEEESKVVRTEIKNQKKIFKVVTAYLDDK